LLRLQMNGSHFLTSVLLLLFYMTMIMSMGWDYVSELRPQAGIFFIPHVIHEHGEPWWNDIDRGKLLIRPPVTWQSYQKIWRNLAKEFMNLAFGVSLFIRRSDFFTCRQMWHGANGFTCRPKEVVLRIFYRH
jgi:hypothetical protein